MAKAVRKRKSRDNAWAIVLVTVVVFCLALVVRLRVTTLEEKDRYYAQKEDSLKEQLEEQEERAAELEEYRVYVQTKQYYEEIAKEKLGLVNPDEILLKPNN